MYKSKKNSWYFTVLLRSKKDVHMPCNRLNKFLNYSTSDSSRQKDETNFILLSS